MDGVCHSHHFETADEAKLSRSIPAVQGMSSGVVRKTLTKLSRWSAITPSSMASNLHPIAQPWPMRLLTKTSWPLHSMKPHPCDRDVGFLELEATNGFNHQKHQSIRFMISSSRKTLRKTIMVHGVCVVCIDPMYIGPRINVYSLQKRR